jgi:cell division protease FtsH
MSEKVGPMSLGHDDPNSFFGGATSKISGATAQLIDEEVTRLLNEAHDQAVRILNQHRELLTSLSELLLVVETIDGADLEAYAAGTKPIPDPDAIRREQPAAVPPRPQTAATSRLTTPTPQTPPMPVVE